MSSTAIVFGRDSTAITSGPSCGGFPWNRHEEANAHLNEPDAWWREINRLISDAFASVGLAPEDVHRCTRHFREVFSTRRRGRSTTTGMPPSRGCRPRGGGTSSCRTTELPRLAAQQLGLVHHFDDIITSARVGYEKPRPEIFRQAIRRVAPGPVVMVGDNPVADMGGAQAVGIPGFLVRREHEDHPHHPDLRAVTETLSRVGDELA